MASADVPGAQPHPIGRAVRIAASVVVLVGIGLVVFWPMPPHPADGGPYRQVLEFLWDHGMPRWFTFMTAEFCANIALFVPFGMVAYWWKPSIVRDTMLGFAASCLIEAAQGAFVGGRVADPRDIASNTIGALVGSVIAAVAVRIAARRRRLASR